METLGYIFSVLIGLSLGLLGAGGSILTVPVLVYFFRIDPLLAVRYSLLVVGITSASSTIPKLRNGQVLIFQGSIFGLMSMLVIWLTRRYLLPAIPPVLYQTDTFTLTYAAVSMIAFALIMLMAAKGMIMGKRTESTDDGPPPSHIALILSAMVTGLITGLLGAGGGFLIVPALMFFFRLDIKTAIGTSLYIIAINALTGFLTDISTSNVEWQLLITVSFLAILGSLVGQKLSQHLDTKSLKSYFGWFILVMGLFIITSQLYQLKYQQKHNTHLRSMVSKP